MRPHRLGPGTVIDRNPGPGSRGRSQAISDHRPPGRVLYGYLARELVSPTLLSLLGLTAVMLTKELLGYSDLVINRGLGADAVFQIAFFQIIPLLTVVFPLAVLMGVLVALGRLGADLEILVLETLGIRATRLAGPIGVFALVMSLLCLFLSLVASPWASRSLDEALLALSRENPAAQMRAGKINRFGDWRLEAREVSARGDKMKNVLLWMPDVSDTVFATSGTLTANAEGGIDMVLKQGRVILEPGKNGPRHLEFDFLKATLPDSDQPIEREDDQVVKGASMAELRVAADDELERGRRYPQSLVEWHRRLSTPVTALIFGLIAIPLFLTRKEYSRSAGGVWGLGTIIAYFGMVQLGDGLIQDQTLSAAWGVWLPNTIIAAAGLWLFSTIARKGVFGRDVDRQRGGGGGKKLARRYRGPKRWALQRYVAGRFIQFAFLAFGILLSAYLLIDILDRLSWFAKYEATGMEVVRFYGARVPLLASRVIPMSLLVGTALTASHLAVQGELIGMRVCGIPAPRALMPVLLLCLSIVPLFFLLNNEIIPRASARQDEIKLNEIKQRRDTPSRERRAKRKERPPVWYRVSGQLYQVGRLDVDRGIAEEIAIYDLTKKGLPIRKTFADSARHIGKGNWRLVNARKFELHGDRFYEAEPAQFARLGEELPAKVDTMHFSIEQLVAEIEEVEANDLDATALWVDYYGKLASPLACIVLPAIVLFFAVMGPPFPTSSTTLLLSGGLGVGYILLGGTGASLGYGGAIPAMLAGWGPTGILALLALGLAARLGGRGQPLSRRS